MLAGTRLGPYEIIEPIGHGGMGEVYRAHDARLHRDVAVKTLASRAIHDPEFRDRFDREARAVAALSHPNVVPIYDVGTHDTIPYIVVEYLQGETLRRRLETGTLPLHIALDYAIQIGRGLGAAHDRGIAHRDLKPENIFITRDGQVKILDFGIATEPERGAADDMTRLATERGAAIGTAGYMSPEQARGERTDARTDIFSFGCVLYEMVAGRAAFAGNTRIDTLHAVLNDDPPPFASLHVDVPPALDRVVRRCLEKAPSTRFQNARDLVFALETLSTRSDTQPTTATRSRSNIWRTAIAASVIAALASAAWRVAVSRKAAPREHTTAAANPPEPRPLLAVLPLENISRSGTGYFAAGMTEEIRSQLSKLSGLRVVGPTAVAQFSSPRTQLPDMAKALGIGSVVTGTVREDGSRVRVNVELLDARSGQVIWSDQYDREGVDVFAAQSDIALRVAGALNASVTLDEQARVGKRPTTSVAAYELYVRARDLRGANAEQRLKTSIDLLRQAVAIDPQFAEAYSEIANQCYFQAAYGDLPAAARGLEAARKALGIDPQLASAHRGLALNLHQLGRLQEALPAYRKAVELDPNYTSGLNDLAFGESAAGHFDAALKSALRALDLTANTPVAYYHAGVAMLGLDDDARTERFLTSAAQQFPTSMRLQIVLSILDLRRGQPHAALDRIRSAAGTSPDNIEVLLTRAEISTFTRAPDGAEIVRALMPRAADGLFHSAPYPVKLAHALQLQQAGATRDAAKILDEVFIANQKAIVGGADWPIAFMQNAAVHAMRGERTAALDDLERAYAAGWRDGRLLAIDPLLEPVRTDPRFTNLLSRISADVAAMRQRAVYPDAR